MDKNLETCYRYLLFYFGDILSTQNPVDLSYDFMFIISNESECYFGETKEQDGLVCTV